MWKVPLFQLDFDHRERDAAAEVVQGGWLTMGERIQGFEGAFGGFLGGDVRGVAVSSGTAALHLALLALDVGPGDEVIIPALTFVADANVVAMVGATPVLADSASLVDWNVSVASIEEQITSRTKAVIVVHYAGYPCDMAAISALCRDKGVALIEDVAHAPGAAIEGRRCGTFGDIGCFSFFSNKNLSLGEGGMAVTCNESLERRLRYLRSHGMTTLTLDRHRGRAISYDVVAPGLNYRMDEIRAAIGMVQLEKLPAGNRRRGELTARYHSHLEGTPVGLPFGTMSPGWVSAYHILPVLLPVGADRVAVIEALKGKGIQASIHYPPFWGFSGYEGMFDAGATPVAAEIMERELTLPLFPGMSDAEVDYVTEALLAAIGE